MRQPFGLYAYGSLLHAGNAIVIRPEGGVSSRWPGDSTISGPRATRV